MLLLLLLAVLKSVSDYCKLLLLLLNNLFTINQVVLTHIVRWGKIDESNNNNSSGVGGNDVYRGRVELVLVSFLDLYLLLDSILVNASDLSSSSILHCLPTT